MEPGALAVTALVVVGVAGVLLLPMRKQWNADGAADRARADFEDPEERPRARSP